MTNVTTKSVKPTQSIFSLSLTVLDGVGEKLAQKLNKLDCYSVGDLLLHLPTRYQNRTRILPIAQFEDRQQGVCEAQVINAQVQYGRRRSLLVTMRDASATLTLRFFYFGQSQQARFTAGKWFRCFGEMRLGVQGATMIHPECQSIPYPGASFNQETTLTPLYPLANGLTQATLRKLTRQALSYASETYLPELLDEQLWRAIGAPISAWTLAHALRLIHYPPPEDEARLRDFAHPAQHRLVFEELLAEQLALMQLRDQSHALQAPIIRGDGSLTNALLMSLPFEPTKAQHRVGTEIYADLAQERPMQRLVQGDVGSGKTLVAAIAILRAIESSHQAVLMAPTEILAEQHYQTLKDWFAPLGVQVDWLTGKRKGKSRTAVIAMIASGEAQVIVGTHAVFQEQVQFHNLSLVIIDEQHRFGVGQRSTLRSKGISKTHVPHQLILTATPIPRTLAMTLYADLDISVIDELPLGRTPIKTVALANDRRAEIISRAHRVCRDGGQVYWVCSLIEPSEEISAMDALSLYEALTAQLPDIKVGLVHGRMRAGEKDEIMQAFKANELQILVATTVIEVGVDVPNASIMVIENAERFGLSQLHQLRGRVGRGSVESFCLLMFDKPLGDIAKARIETMRETSDGFVIAQKDLELRGAGEVLGTRQTGEQGFRIANLGRDAHLLPTVQSAAHWLRSEQPQRAEAIIHRWQAHRLGYGNV